MIRILVVDDNPLMRKLLKQIIEGDPEFQVVAQAATREEAMGFLAKDSFDVILVDISLQEKDGGVLLVRQIRKAGVNTPVLSVSLHEQSLYEDQLREAGAQGYLMKQDAVENILLAIQDLHEGKLYWPVPVGQK